MKTTCIGELFTQDEAEAMIGSRVITRVSFDESHKAGTTGTVEKSHQSEDGGFMVIVEWERRACQFPSVFSREEFEDYLVTDHLETTQQRIAFYARYELFLGKIAGAVNDKRSLDEIKALVDTAMITDDCPVCTHPWGYCICKADR